MAHTVAPLALLAVLLTGSVFAQVETLPTEIPLSTAPGFIEGEATAFGQPSSEVVKPLLDLPRDVGPSPVPPGPPLVVEEVDPDRPPDARDGFFQKLLFSATWLTSDGAAAWDMTDLELKTVLAVPVPSRRWPMLVTPGFAAHHLDGPAAPDVPAWVYDSYLQFRWWRRVHPRLGLDMAVTPGLYGDYQRTDDGALRITGYFAGMITWTQEAKIVLGASYLDRDDFPVLPLGGLIWTPNDAWKLEIFFPRPKLARRLYWAGALGEDVKDWLYLVGELGGGVWAIDRAGIDDVLTYRDYRLMLGLERWSLRGLDYRLEAGYAFARKITYRTPTPDIYPADALLLSGGITY